VVQGYGAPGADPWPGKLSATNPVKVAVAFDSLITDDTTALMPLNCLSTQELTKPITQEILLAGKLPRFGPRIPSLSFSADYCVAPTPYLAPPDAEFTKGAYKAWQKAKIPTYALSFQGTTHFDFSPAPTLPSTSWCPDSSNGACRGGWGVPAISHYSVAWFDRWLKLANEKGFADADARLIDDAGPQGVAKMSFRHHCARDFVDRQGRRQNCENIRAGCFSN
jgi:hypothetical protein